MLAAEEPGLVDHLLLLSYPLHPPRRPTDLRTAHFPALQTPALFVHGTRDPFGLPDELELALKLIPAPTTLLLIDRAGHELKSPGVGERIAAAFTAGII
jgi:predicted alpha/beta-hydrolase family hydrolase